MKTKIAIIGAGPSGLALAHTLLRRGVGDFLVLEREEEAGGLCRTRMVDGSPLDIGGRLLLGEPARTLDVASRTVNGTIEADVVVNTAPWPSFGRIDKPFARSAFDDRPAQTHVGRRRLRAGDARHARAGDLPARSCASRASPARPEQFRPRRSRPLARDSPRAKRSAPSRRVPALVGVFLSAQHDRKERGDGGASGGDRVKPRLRTRPLGRVAALQHRRRRGARPGAGAAARVLPPSCAVTRGSVR